MRCPGLPFIRHRLSFGNSSFRLFLNPPKFSLNMGFDDSTECSCKGVRACTLCEANRGRKPGQRLNIARIRRVFVFCPNCRICFEVDPKNGERQSGLIHVPGIEVVEEAISESEETFLEESIERTAWVESQSGRRKQDFGPKVNFKKQRVKVDAFQGFPSYMDTVMSSFAAFSNESMRDFEPVELCNLKYSPERGSCIDPHFDDFWLWGERLVTLNLRGPTVLTFSRAQDFIDLTQPSISSKGPPEIGERYTLTTDAICRLSRSHGCTRRNELSSNSHTENVGTEETIGQLTPQVGDVVHVALPRRSAVLVANEARHHWHHSVLREHIVETRVAMTVRELSDAFRNPQKEFEFSLGRQLLEKAKVNLSL